jgi:hypothetical protein
MAVVKATYTKSRAGAKETIRYITQRPGRDGQPITRMLFGHDGVVGKHQAYRMIDEARRGTVFFRIVISPDPTREDTHRDLNLWEITTQTIQSLEERLGKEVPFVAVEHDDHAPHRHVHILALVQGRLAVQDLAALRHAATEAAQFQRQERDLVREHPRGARIRSSAPPRTARTWTRSTGQGRGYRLRRPVGTKPQLACPRCGRWLGDRPTACSNCGLKIARDQSILKEWER